MADQYRTSMIDSTRNLSFDTVTLLTTSTINTLHFPGLSTSEISDSGGSRRTSILLDGIGMCESMTESFCSTSGLDDGAFNHNSKIERRDSTKKRRSRKAKYDASIDSPSLDKIEPVNVIGEQNEPDDAWLYEVPKSGDKDNLTKDNIFSWVHKEFKTNDIHANKHRLLCKLDDMSNARTIIRSLSCHNFLDNQRSDSVPRSSTEQQVYSEPVKNGRLSSPLRSTIPSFSKHGNTQSISPIHTSREVSKERLDYTDLQVMAKVQLENLRQAERQGPLSKRFGGSNASLASTNSGTSVGVPNRSTTKPPVAPKSAVIRSSVRPNAYQRSYTQTIVSSSCDTPVGTESKPLVTLKTRVSLLPPNSANNNRTRPPTARPIQAYRGSQTTYTTSSVQRNGLLHDVSNKPLTAPQRRTVLPQATVEQIPSTTNGQTTLPRSSSSSFSQGRKSGIPTVGKSQKPSAATVTRSTSIPTSKSSDNLMVTTRPQISKPTSLWNDGCY